MAAFHTYSPDLGVTWDGETPVCLLFGKTATLRDVAAWQVRTLSDEAFMLSQSGDPFGWPRHGMVLEGWRVVWQHEFNRRFLLRSLGPQPNTQDVTTLVRAI